MTYRPQRLLRLLAVSRDREELIRRAGLGPTQEAVVRGLLGGLETREMSQRLGVSRARVYEAIGAALRRLERTAEEVRG